MPDSIAAPLELPRLVMRNALMAAAVTIALAMLLGIWRMSGDIGDEVESAAALAGLMARLGGSQSDPDREVLATLAEAQRQHPLRHLELRVTGPDGRLLLGPPPPQKLRWPLGMLIPLHQWLLPPEQAGRHSWPLTRPDGTSWTVTLATSRESERVEAVESLLGVMVLLLVCVGLMLLVMHWKVRQSFRPLSSMLMAIDRLERSDIDAVARLPTMPIRELESVAGALRHLAAALEHTESERRLLSRKMLTLQEDERMRLARELHDEMGQQLTAIRVDAAWLARMLAQDARLQGVAQSIADRCGAVQSGLRDLLARLRPLDLCGASDQPPALAALIELLHGLVQGWSRSGGQTIDYTLQLRQRIGTASPAPLDPALATRLQLPGELVQAIYRISQEALTNVARHAQARHALLELSVLLPATGLQAQLQCMVCDDGTGIADPAAAMRQGNGLGGMQERVWACGGELSWQVPVDRVRWPGLCLMVQLPFMLSARQPAIEPSP